MRDRTLLYQNDWARQQDYFAPHVHANTKNKSFIVMHSALRQLGVKNNKFFLALYDTSLKDIDPHNMPMAASMDLYIRVIAECKRNFWYIIREVVRVPVTGGDPAPFELNRANLAQYWCWLNNINYLGIQPRQTGKTTAHLIKEAVVTYIIGINISSVLFAKDASLISKNMDEFKKIRDALPQWMLNYNKDLDVNNAQSVYYAALKNKLSTAVCSLSETRANNLARGHTVANGGFDEFAYSPNIDVTYKAFLLATTAAMANAAKHNQPHGLTFLTTAGRPLDASGAYAFEFLQDCLRFSEVLYDLDDHNALRHVLTNGSKNDTIAGVFSHIQLGKTNKWLHDIARMISADEETIRRDLLNQWLFGSSKGVISAELAAKMNSTSVAPLYSEIVKSSYMLDWYVPITTATDPRFLNKKFIIGMDTADNSGRDYTAMVILDIKTMDVVATMRCNESNLVRMAMAVWEIMQRLPNSILVPERKSSAPGFIDHLMVEMEERRLSPFKRIYNKLSETYESISSDMHDAFCDGYPPTKFDKLRPNIGFMTNAASRGLLYGSVLKTTLESNSERLFSKPLIDELCALQEINGRIDHPAGGHDDLAIAYLLACYFVYYARNKQCYDISYADLPDRYISSSGTTSVTISEAEYKEQIFIRRALTAIERDISTATDMRIKRYFEEKRDALLRRLRTDITPEMITVDTRRDGILR